jgi:hypothetical protein
MYNVHVNVALCMYYSNVDAVCLIKVHMYNVHISVTLQMYIKKHTCKICVMYLRVVLFSIG